MGQPYTALFIWENLSNKQAGGTMRFFRYTEKETLKIIIDENKRLKRENQRLHESLNELQRYKDEYKDLIEKVGELKNEYMSKLEAFSTIENNYKKELERLIKQQKPRR